MGTQPIHEDNAMSDTDPKLAQAALNVAAILSVIVQMSDDVKNAASPLDAQGKLLRMQNSIQKNAARIVPHVRVIHEAAAAAEATSQSTRTA
jgi:hypothetical protein